MSWNRIYVCSEGHEYKAKELSAHEIHWNLAEISQFRCPDCHRAIVWTYKYQSSAPRAKSEENGS